MVCDGPPSNFDGSDSCGPDTRRGISFIGLLWLLLLPLGFNGADADNCLMCHRYRGLARVDKEGAYRLYLCGRVHF